MYMLVIDEAPSGSVIMFALSRPLAGDGVGIAQPDWTSPLTGSFCCRRSVVPKFDCCSLKFCSVNPRKYEKSCILLCATNRFTVAAESS
jgi:hypothetical protein